MNKENYSSIDDILDAILCQEPEPTHDALLRWCQRYPKHCEALTDFFATWTVQKELPGEAPIDEVRVANLMVSHALNLLHRQKSTCGAEGKAMTTSRLSAEIAARKESEEEFGRRCGLDESIVAKFDRRLIRVPSIPLLCLQRIAAALSWDVEAVTGILHGPPIPLGAYKAHGRPAPKVEDFIDAVRTSDLSEEEKEEWIRIIGAKA